MMNMGGDGGKATRLALAPFGLKGYKCRMYEGLFNLAMVGVVIFGVRKAVLKLFPRASNNVSGGIGLAFGVAVLCCKWWLGAKVPGSWFERSIYITEIMVNVRPENSKLTYHTSATIEAGCKDEVWWKDDHTYHLLKFDLPSGRVTFYPDSEVAILDLGDFEYVSDDKGRDWHVELTNEPPPRK